MSRFCCLIHSFILTFLTFKSSTSSQCSRFPTCHLSFSFLRPKTAFIRNLVFLLNIGICRRIRKTLPTSTATTNTNTCLGQRLPPAASVQSTWKTRTELTDVSSTRPRSRASAEACSITISRWKCQVLWARFCSNCRQSISFSTVSFSLSVSWHCVSNRFFLFFGLILYFDNDAGRFF